MLQGEQGNDDIFKMETTQDIKEITTTIQGIEKDIDQIKLNNKTLLQFFMIGDDSETRSHFLKDADKPMADHSKQFLSMLASFFVEIVSSLPKKETVKLQIPINSTAYVNDSPRSNSST